MQAKRVACDTLTVLLQFDVEVKLGEVLTLFKVTYAYLICAQAQCMQQWINTIIAFVDEIFEKGQAHSSSDRTQPRA